jgi:hypothetical protein
MTQQDVQGRDAATGPPPPYSVWKVDTSIYDEQMNLVDQFTDTQELWISPPNFAVRRTRDLDGGGKVVYEDRGTMNERLSMSGTDGFGGSYRGQMFPDGQVYAQGTGGNADFTIISTPQSDTEAWCMRTIDVRTATPWLTPQDLAPGRYYVTTVDRFERASEDVPETMTKPVNG